MKLSEQEIEQRLDVIKYDWDSYVGIWNLAEEVPNKLWDKFVEFLNDDSNVWVDIDCCEYWDKYSKECTCGYTRLYYWYNEEDNCIDIDNGRTGSTVGTAV